MNKLSTYLFLLLASSFSLHNVFIYICGNRGTDARLGRILRIFSYVFLTKIGFKTILCLFKQFTASWSEILKSQINGADLESNKREEQKFYSILSAFTENKALPKIVSK